MRIPFIIYFRAVGRYAIITLPALVVPVIYIISLTYVFIYGWFAWALFTLIYLSIERIGVSSAAKSFLLLCGVVVSVVFAFQMLEVLNVRRNIWHSGLFLLFPIGAVIAGWISVVIAERRGNLFLARHELIS